MVVGTMAARLSPRTARSAGAVVTPLIEAILRVTLLRKADSTLN